MLLISDVLALHLCLLNFHSEAKTFLEKSTISFPDDSSIAVTFHALVPLKAWGWDQNTPTLNICFGHKDLGNWNATTTEFKHTR